MKFKYIGHDERVFPGVKVIVKPGDEFDAPEGFTAANVVPVTEKVAPVKPAETKETKAVKETKETITMSAASDHKLGDE